MARTKLSPAEAEKRKLERRAAKKAKRKLAKAGVEVVDTTVKKSKSKSAGKLIEVQMSDAAGHKKIGELKEAGIPVKQIAFASDAFIYEVPSNVTGFKEYSTVVPKEKAAPKKSLKTVTDLALQVDEDKEAGVKMNKRYIKLLVRNSDLKRNEKAAAVATLLKKYKIK